MKQANGVKRIFPAVVLSMAFAVLVPSSSWAGDGQTLGDVLVNTSSSFETFPNIFSMIAYLSGLFLTTSGIFKLRDHVNGLDKGGQAPALSDGVKRFIAAGGFFSAPFMTEVVSGSVFGGSGGVTSTGGSGGSVNGDGLDALVVRLMSDIAAPTEFLLTTFCYLFGLAFLLLGLSRLTKRMDEGPRGPAGMGTIMTFVTSGALFAFGDMMGAFSSSLFGDAQIATRVTIADGLGIGAEDSQRIATVIEGVMTFVMIVGIIAFIRGWFVLRAFADGTQGATLAQGLTFLFGGALAINLGELVNAMQNTLGIAGLSFV